MMATIKLPSSQVVTTDKDGFENVFTNWITGIPAEFNDCTRQDVDLAYAAGYTAEQNVKTFRGNYSGQPYLINEQTGEKWYIERSFNSTKGNYVILTCSRRIKHEYRD